MKESKTTEPGTPAKLVSELESVTIRFAGDSGGGLQITGDQFTDSSALYGNDLATLPDFPAEIRAPAGTVAGVSAFQIHFSSQDIKTPGDDLNVLVAMNAAALKANIADLEIGGILVVDEAGFGDRDIKKAEYASNPLEDGSLSSYKVISLDISQLTVNAVSKVGLKGKAAERCKNFFTLGIMFWLYERPLKPTLEWIDSKFGPGTKYEDKPEISEANKAALQAGYNYALTVELFPSSYRVAKAKLEKGTYRKISGNQALVLGLVTAGKLGKRDLFYAGYPITPASDILHGLAKHRRYGVRTFQAEDEIAAICAAIGASYAGGLAVTASSGPGLCLKLEAMNLAVIAELPLVIIDVQRGGPSTGLPTKTEQSDLLLALGGRSGDSPLPVLAASTPGDCFDMAIEASRIAMKYMTPVILLTDGYLANGSEPWKVPEESSLPEFSVPLVEPGESFQPYARDPVTLARKWAVPGMQGFEHRIGGLEKARITGEVSYDPENHHAMTLERHDRIQAVAQDIPPVQIEGNPEAEVLVVSWGGTYGSVSTAINKAREEGIELAHIHLRYLNPFPLNLEQELRKRKKILIPELNMGQLRQVIGGAFGIIAEGINVIRGKPFKVSYLVEQFHKAVEK